MSMSLEKPAILYVEDDRLSRMVLQVLFIEVMGISNLTVFENSQNFMERVKALPNKPELVFLDIQMKPHDGYELLKMLRDDPEYKTTKTIALTANVMAHDVDQLKKAGFDGLIGKPVMEEIFPQLVKKILTGEQIWYVP